MANTGVTGRIIDEKGDGIGGLIVAVFDVDGIVGDLKLGQVTTSSAGTYTLVYSKSSYGWLESNPDIRIRVYNSFKRLLYESPEFTKVTDSIFEVEEIVISNKILNGWRVTLQTDSFKMLSENGNRIELHIDNKENWEKITEAVEGAKSSIYCAQFYFDVPNAVFIEGQLIGDWPTFDSPRLFTVFKSPFDPNKPPICEKSLEQVLLTVNRNKDIDVLLLIRDVIGAPYPVDTAEHVRNFFNVSDKIEPHDIQVQFYSSAYNTTLHAKFFIIDNTIAYSNSTLVN